MADLILSEDSKQYQDLARDFSQNELAPRAEAFDHCGELPKDLWKKAWELGLINARLPEEFGGLGLSLLDATVITEELAAGCAGISAAFWGNDLAVAPLLVAGAKEQKQKYLEPLLSEFSLAGYCFGELTARKNGDGWALAGEAIALNGTQSAWLLVEARTADGITGLIVKNAAPGVVADKKAARIGLKAADLTSVRFDNAIGLPVCQQWESMKTKIETVTAPIIAAVATGIGRAAMEHAVRYSKERYTMGQPIANHQAVGFMLADMAKNTEASRLLTRKAAWLVDHNEGCLTESLNARHFATEMAMVTATDAVQVFGGYGYSREYPVEKLMRDAKMLQAYCNNAVETRLQVGRKLVGAHA